MKISGNQAESIIVAPAFIEFSWLHDKQTDQACGLDITQ